MSAFGVLVLALMMSIIMAIAWKVQRVTGSSGWIDTIWSLAVGAGGVTAALMAVEGNGVRRMVALALVTVWALRLGAHIAARTRGGGEDPRYAALIEEWGTGFSARLFWFLQIQAACALALVLAVYAAASNPEPFGSILDYAALALAILSIAGEALADRQLAQFRVENKGKGLICEKGLWAYSRHPNYFFEWLGWCGWPLLALNLSGSHWIGLVAFIAPLLMYWLLVHVSGIPPLEAHMLRSRGDAFRDLQSRVNAFFPGPRRQSPRHTLKEAQS